MSIRGGVPFLLLGCSSAFAYPPGNWQIISYSQEWPDFTTIVDMFFLENGLNGWAAGYHQISDTKYSSTVYRTLNGGESWTPYGMPTSVRLTSVSFSTADSGCATGWSGKILTTADGGQSWSSATSGTVNNLFENCFIDHLTGWAVGGYAPTGPCTVLRTVDGGLTWQNLNPGLDGIGHAVWFTDPQNGWLGGVDEDGYMLARTCDGGITWIPSQLPPLSNLVSVSSIEFLDSQTGWITTNGNISHAFYTDDCGQTWEAEVSNYRNYSKIAIMDSSNIAMLGAGPQYLEITNDGGETWTGHNGPSTNTQPAIDYTNSTLWVGGHNQIYRSDNFGVTWVQQLYPQDSNPYLSISWADENSGWVVCGTDLGECSQYTDDGGLTWQTVPTPGGEEVAFADADRGWILRTGNPAAVYRTTNGGASWSSSSPGTTPGTILRLLPVSCDSVWIYGNNGSLLLSKDGGVTWIDHSFGGNLPVLDLEFSGNQHGWAAGGDGTHVLLRRTVDGGATWQSLSFPSSSGIAALSLTDVNHGWAATVNGGVFCTSNGGSGWTAMGTIPFDSIEDLIMVDGSTGWSMTNENSRGVLCRTDDSCDSWIVEYVTPDEGCSLFDFGEMPDGTPWACGDNSLLVRYSAITGIEPRIELDRTVTVFPNPVSASAIIAFPVAEPCCAEVYVYDVSGHLTSRTGNLPVEAGSVELPLSAEELPSGVYLLLVRAGTEILRGSFLVLR